MDKRVIRTKERLFNALSDLLKEKPLTDIKVQEIADRAHLNRVTIYAHYEDKNDLYNQFVQTLIQKMFQNVNSMDPYERILGTFRFVKENIDIFRILVEGRDRMVFANTLNTWIFDYTKKYLEIHGKVDDLIDARTQFISYGIYGLLIWWINNPDAYTPEQMADIYIDLLRPLYRTAKDHI